MSDEHEWNDPRSLSEDDAEINLGGFLFLTFLLVWITIILLFVLAWITVVFIV